MTGPHDRHDDAAGGGSDLARAYWVQRGRGKGHSEAVRRLARRFGLDVQTVERRLRPAAQTAVPRSSADSEIDFHALRVAGVSHAEAARRVAEAKREGE